MPWKAFKRLLEMHEIVLGYEDSQNLHRIIKVQGDPEIIQYKQALQHLQPNIEQDDPIKAVWTIRLGPIAGE